MVELLNLLPPYALDTTAFMGEAVRVDEGFVEIDVSKDIALSMNRQRLLAYLIVKELVEMWEHLGGYDYVTLYMFYDDDPDDPHSRDYVLFAIGETTENGIVKVTMGR